MIRRRRSAPQWQVWMAIVLQAYSFSARMRGKAAHTSGRGRSLGEAKHPRTPPPHKPCLSASYKQRGGHVADTTIYRLALIGFGSAGQGLAQILRDHGDALARRYG